MTRTVSFLQDGKHPLLSSLVAFDLSKPLILTKSCSLGENQPEGKRMSRYGKGQREQGLPNPTLRVGVQSLNSTFGF